MKKVIIVLLITLAFPTLNAQQKATEWTLLKTKDNISVYYKYASCYLENVFDQEWVLLKFVNPTKNKVSIEWDMEIYSSQNCLTCEDTRKEYHRTLELDPISEISGNCGRPRNQALSVFSKFIDPNYKSEKSFVLTKFDLVNFKVVRNGE